MINFSKFNSLYSVATYFNTESKCRQAIVTSRWGDDVVCPYCGQHHCNQRMFAASIGVVDYEMVKQVA